eukprot:2411087-Amphidinium_carterae.1
MVYITTLWHVGTHIGAIAIQAEPLAAPVEDIRCVLMTLSRWNRPFASVAKLACSSISSSVNRKAPALCCNAASTTARSALRVCLLACRGGKKNPHQLASLTPIN